MPDESRCHSSEDQNSSPGPETIAPAKALPPRCSARSSPAETKGPSDAVPFRSVAKYRVSHSPPPAPEFAALQNLAVAIPTEREFAFLEGRTHCANSAELLPKEFPSPITSAQRERQPWAQSPESPPMPPKQKIHQHHPFHSAPSNSPPPATRSTTDLYRKAPEKSKPATPPKPEAAPKSRKSSPCAKPWEPRQNIKRSQ